LRYFENEYRAHLDRNCCEAGVCRELIEFSIDAEACTGCTACSRACPIDAIAGEKKGPHRIDPLVCIHCGSCRSACKFDAVKMGTRTAMAPPAPAAVG